MASARSSKKNSALLKPFGEIYNGLKKLLGNSYEDQVDEKVAENFANNLNKIHEIVDEKENNRKAARGMSSVRIDNKNIDKKVLMNEMNDANRYDNNKNIQSNYQR